MRPAAAPTPFSALPPAELARLAALTLRARVIVEGAFAGLHHNRHAGSAVEFTEHKEYAPGDDVRRLDWKALARIDRYYVKRFEDDTEMRTHLVLDVSASMGYARGGPSKLTFAVDLTAAIAYLVARQGDAPGLTLVDAALRAVLPPATRSGQVAEIFARLAAAAPAGGTDLTAALDRVGESAHGRGLVIVLSDLLDVPPAAAERLRRLCVRGHDVVVLHVLHPDEIELPFEDPVELFGVEPGDARLWRGDARDVRDAFRDASAAFREGWRRALLEAGAEYRLASVADEPGAVLRAFLATRHRLRRSAA